MFKRILIANRGEIAVRIIRTCRDMGIETVLPFAEPDRESLAVALADQAICVGPAPAAQSYLNEEAILSIALATGAEAIHPGYGFLAENANFAERVEGEGLIFIGPSPAVIRAMGDKIAARETMAAAGLPVIPGSTGAVDDVAAAQAIAAEAGFPLLIKAAAGGGGRGMRLVAHAEALEGAFHAARQEALAAFGNGSLYVEKFLTGAKHVEVQLLADAQGHVVHLGERDCSLQRNHQKILEETPCRTLSAALRKEICETAVQAVAKVGYTGAGTIECLVTPEGDWYFMEMNTRIQVEHPISEWVSGIDIVRAQLRVAAGLPLEWRQEDILLRGHSIECRINAEDPKRRFRPSAGQVQHLYFPQGPAVRIDAALVEGDEVSVYYDSMVAKISVWGETRQVAIRRMRRALSELVIEGIETTMDLQFILLHHVGVVRGDYDTHFLDDHLDELVDLL